MRPHCLIALLFLIFFTPSCAKISISLSPYITHKLFINTPKNNFVFDNIAPLIHKELTKHYRRMGYTLVNNAAEGLQMAVTVVSLTPQTKFISPDILLLHLTIKLVLECTLYDHQGKELARKCFSYSSLINKPRHSILRSSFLMYEYQKLLQRSLYGIEQYFRPFFLQ